MSVPNAARLAMVAALLATGCTDPQARIFAGSDQLQPWFVAESPTVTIGGHDARPEYTLYNVVGATRLSDGAVVIANSGTAQLKIFDATGVHQLDAGGSGEGPGELLYIVKMARLAGDTLLVLSTRPGLTWYSPEGRYIRSSPRDLFGVPNHPCRFGESLNWKLMTDGTVLRLLEDNLTPRYCPPEA